MIKKNKKGSVYVIIPTYNRVELTRKCLSLLLNQTYKNIRIIVSDGNSSDGTPRIISSEYPEVVLLRSKKNLWWGGAMAQGIVYAHKNSASHHDFILMMNDDTKFPKDYIEKMVDASVKYNSVVGSLMADANHPEAPPSVGVYINWNKFFFSSIKINSEEKSYCNDIDTLPGRGTIIPIDIVRDVGNINVKKFPHYFADYEYFCRIKERGYTLFVTYETKIFMYPDKTGLVLNKKNKINIFKKINIYLSRRSKSNIFAQYNFIDTVAPDNLKKVLKMRFIPQRFHKVIYYLEKK
jgi:GT2 family glycosyltransferase